MNEAEIAASGWSILLGPTGGIFAAGMLAGAGVMFIFMNRFYVPKIEAALKERIVALESQVEVMKPVVDKWVEFTEKRAMESIM